MLGEGDVSVTEVRELSPTKKDILQFDPGNIFTQTRTENIISRAQDIITHYAQSDEMSGYPYEALNLLYLLMLNPETQYSSNIFPEETVSYIEQRALTITNTNQQWVELLRLLRPAKVTPDESSLQNLESVLKEAIHSNDASDILSTLHAFALYDPEKAKKYETEDTWQTIKSDLEKTVQSQHIKANLFFMNSALQSIQLIFGGRVRELSFFPKLWENLNETFQKYKNTYDKNSIDMLMYTAYYLTALTSDGLEITENGGLRIIPHQASRGQTTPSLPEEVA